MFLKILFYVSLIGMTALAAMATAAPQGLMTVHIQLRPEAVVAGRSVTLGDIAVVADTTGARPGLDDLRVANAPLAGHVTRLSREEVDRLVRRRFSGLAQVNWSGAAAVDVRIATQLVSADTIRKIAENHLQKDLAAGYRRLEVDLAAPVADVEVPAGEVVLKPRPLTNARLRPRLPVWIDVYVEGVFYRSVVVPLAVAACRTVYVAGRNLAEGALASAGDFVAREEELASDSGEYASAADLHPGQRLRKALAVGQALTRKDLAAPGTAFRGEQVTLVATEGAVMIRTPASLEHEARIGEVVKVRTENGMDAVPGRLVSAGLVQAINSNRNR